MISSSTIRVGGIMSVSSWGARVSSFASPSSCASTIASYRLLSAGDWLSTSTRGGFGVDVEAVFFAFAAFSNNVNMLAPFFFIYDTRMKNPMQKKLENEILNFNSEEWI